VLRTPPPLLLVNIQYNKHGPVHGCIDHTHSWHAQCQQTAPQHGGRMSIAYAAYKEHAVEQGALCMCLMDH
jgi:hypothetical protein